MIRVALTVLLLTAAPLLPAVAAELLMFEKAGCPWCLRWNAKVGGVYAKTEEGARAPLRRVDLFGPMPADVELSSKPRFAPTFVLVENGREIGRIEGYPGEDFFWGLLGRMLKELPPEGGGVPKNKGHS